MSKHLVFVGGGHAHLTCLKNLQEFTRNKHRVTLISPSPYHYYSGMGPGMLSRIYRPQEVRFHVKKMAEDRGGTFIMGVVNKIDADRRVLFLSSGESIAYDVVSFNTGSEVPVASLVEADQKNVFTVKPVLSLLDARQHLVTTLRQKRLNLVVVGGGPAGVEISANLWRLVKESGGEAGITLIGGKRLLGEAPARVRELAFNSLVRKQVQVVEGRYAKRIEPKEVILDEDTRLQADVAFVAVGIRPASIFRNSGLPTGEDGGLLVNPFLQSVARPEIFGGGDCISLEGYHLAKVGVYAVRQNPILRHNLWVALEGGEMATFKPQRTFLLIFNMGDGKGVFWRENWVWEGRLAFLLKDYIDRSFMRTFQVSGELAES